MKSITFDLENNTVSINEKYIVYLDDGSVNVEATCEKFKQDLIAIHLSQAKEEKSGPNFKEINGHGFEFAVFSSVVEFLTENGNLFFIKENKSYAIAKKSFALLSLEDQAAYLFAAKRGTNHICEREPRIKYPTDDRLELTLQSDDKGKGEAGDVRDIVFLRSSQGWEIGFSAKHNSEEIKGNRMPADGNIFKNFGFEPSPTYQTKMIDVNKILSAKSGEEWKTLPTQEKEDIYSATLNAIVSEIGNLSSNADFAKNVCQYYLGSRDHWKIIMIGISQVIIEAINLHSTLNQSIDNIVPVEIIKTISFPKQIINFGIAPKKNITNTIFIDFDNGLKLTLRIKNGDSKVRLSGLKFEVKIIGYPTDYYRHEL